MQSVIREIPKWRCQERSYKSVIMVETRMASFVVLKSIIIKINLGRHFILLVLPTRSAEKNRIEEINKKVNETIEETREKRNTSNSKNQNRVELN